MMELISQQPAPIDDPSTLQCMQGVVNLPYPSSQEDSSSTYLLRHGNAEDDTDFLVITASSLTTMGSLKISKNTLLHTPAKKDAAEQEESNLPTSNDDENTDDNSSSTSSRSSSEEPENQRDSPPLQQRSGLTATEASAILRSRAQMCQVVVSSYLSLSSSSQTVVASKRISFEEDNALEVVTQIAVSEVDTPPSRRKSFAAAASMLFEEAMACATAYNNRNPGPPAAIKSQQNAGTITTVGAPASAKLPAYSNRRDSIEIKMDKTTIAGRGLISVLAAPLVPRRASSGGRAASVDADTPPKDAAISPSTFDTAIVISPPTSSSFSQDQRTDIDPSPLSGDTIPTATTQLTTPITSTNSLVTKPRVIHRNSALEFARLSSSSTNPVLLLRPKPAAPTATHADVKVASGATSVAAFRQINSALRRPPTPAILVPRSRTSSIEVSSSQRERSTSIGGGGSSPPLGTESQPRTPSNSQQHCTTPQQGEDGRPTATIATPSLSPIVPAPRGSPPLGGTSGTFRLSSLFRDTVTATPPKTAEGLQFAATSSNSTGALPPRLSDAPVVIVRKQDNNNRGGGASTFLPLNDVSLMSVTGGDSMMQ